MSTEYMDKSTKAITSALIAIVLKFNWDTLSNTEGYAGHIVTRLMAERPGSYGLFDDADGVDLEKTMSEYTGNVYPHIISLKLENPACLGFNNAAMWRNLLQAHRNDIAAAMNISPDDFRWYVSFHDGMVYKAGAGIPFQR